MKWKGKKFEKDRLVETDEEYIAMCYGRFYIPLGCKEKKLVHSIMFDLPIEICEGGTGRYSFKLRIKDKDGNILEREIIEDRYPSECFSYIKRNILGK